MNSEVDPLTKIQGKNAITVVITPNKTGLATSCAPAIDAFTPPPIRLASLCMPSPTTIASSTTIPSTSKNANVESMFKDTPTDPSKTKAPAYAVAIPTATQNATTGLRVNNNTIMTSTRPMAAELPMVFILLLKSTAWSVHSVSDTPSGSESFLFSIQARTDSDAVTISMISVDMICSRTAGSPLSVASIGLSSKPSNTVATSPTRMRPPSEVSRMMMLLNSVSVSAWLRTFN